jgi:hypothetical protein
VLLQRQRHCACMHAVGGGEAPHPGAQPCTAHAGPLSRTCCKGLHPTLSRCPSAPLSPRAATQVRAQPGAAMHDDDDNNHTHHRPHTRDA